MSSAARDLLPPVRSTWIRCFYILVKVLTASMTGCLFCLSHSLSQFVNFDPVLRRTRRHGANSYVLLSLNVFLFLFLNNIFDSFSSK